MDEDIDNITPEEAAEIISDDHDAYEAWCEWNEDREYDD